MNTTMRLFYSKQHEGYILDMFDDTFFVGEDFVHISFYSMRFEVPYEFRIRSTGQFA